MEQQTENERPLQLNITQSYLEMARYWLMQMHGAQEAASRLWPSDRLADYRQRHNRAGVQKEMPPSLNTAYAILAHTYIFSYMALQAFVAIRLESFWNDPNSTLRSKYPKRATFEDAIRYELGDLKESLKELCRQLQIEQIHQVDNALWMDFTNAVREARDYFNHPKPGPAFEAQVNRVMAEKSWIFPVEVAERIISHFYRQTYTPVPDWVKTNQELFPR